MLSRAAYAGRVCQRCRVQFTLNSTLVRPILLAPTPFPLKLPRLRFSTNSPIDADVTPEPTEKPPAEGEALEQQDGALPPPDTINPTTATARSWAPLDAIVGEEGQTPDLTITRSRQKWKRKERVPRTRGLDIEAPSLGMPILGQPGHTIAAAEDNEGGTAPLSGFDLEESLAEQKRDITVAEARQNITELQPREPRDLLAREFDELLNTLMDGFTVRQLADYVYHFITGKPAASVEERDALIRPLTSHSASARHRTAPAFKWIQAQMALAIMRLCWDLKVMEEAPYIGELEIKADEDTLNFLLLENKVLNAIKRSLGEGASIKIRPENGRVHIFATRSKCETVLARLNDFVSRIAQSSIPLSHLGQRRLENEDLRQLSILTNTYLRYKSRGPKPATESRASTGAILVSRLTPAKDDRHPGLEKTQDVVFRLLHAATSRRAEGTTVSKIVTGDGPSPRLRTSFSPATRATTARCPADPSGTDGGNIPPSVLKLALPPRQGGEDLPAAPSSDWKPHEITTTATFGHILHPFEADGASPFIQLSLSGTLSWPDTEKRLLAVPTTHRAKIQIPSAPSDVEITQTIQHQMRADALDAAHGLRAFVETAALDLAAGDLRTPASLAIALPTAIFTRAPANRHAKSASGAVPSSLSPSHTEPLAQEEVTQADSSAALPPAAKTVNVAYTFAGLELHTTASIPFRGHILRYTAVEGGHRAGRSGRLSLEAAPAPGDDGNSSSASPSDSKLQRAFLKEVAQIARGAYFPWTGTRPVDHVASTEDMGA
ncbi:unnamed protein product [Parascedosporium putredinis]|uniref:Uncharacterized protein n=1 Tax=Parascedosporium putredinis TaxID=1442378 RepID=A0A9P1H9T7_9PEZI|nr:unnamed protein product [Parascedosporium putredinis]CAI8001324.1 unnamed protein product [Parascedosporium putredinis]